MRCVHAEHNCLRMDLLCTPKVIGNGLVSPTAVQTLRSSDYCWVQVHVNIDLRCPPLDFKTHQITRRGTQLKRFSRSVPLNDEPQSKNRVNGFVPWVKPILSFRLQLQLHALTLIRFLSAILSSYGIYDNLLNVY